jgi:hypothetical protein
VNSTTDWETGAFCQNQLGHPDYGWGRYNSASHDVVGDSLYLIKLRDGSLRKLWIMRKYSSLNTYEFRYANLDGSGDTTVVLDCNPYSDKNFVGFSLTTNQVVDFEPVSSTDWDILFTKYMYTYPDGVLYPVTGVLSNYDIKVNKFEHVAPDFRAFDPAAMDSSRSAIGWDWKYLDGSFCLPCRGFADVLCTGQVREYPPAGFQRVCRFIDRKDRTAERTHLPGRYRRPYFTVSQPGNLSESGCL